MNSERGRRDYAVPTTEMMARRRADLAEGLQEEKLSRLHRSFRPYPARKGAHCYFKSTALVSNHGLRPDPDSFAHSASHDSSQPPCAQYHSTYS